jgi:plastocyanin
MRGVIVALLTLSASLLARGATAQLGPAPLHAIYMTAVEFKGSTTIDRLAPPPVNPATMSRGYMYRAPGDADPASPHTWEVASYRFSPGFVGVPQGASVVLSVFIANGDHHEVTLTAPDGQSLVTKATWDRGREYTMFFVADQLGPYRLNCGTHAPSMTATIMVLPR